MQSTENICSTVTLPLAVDNSVNVQSFYSLDESRENAALNYPSAEPSIAEFYNNFDYGDAIYSTLQTDETVALKLHRGLVFDELLLRFSDLNFPCGPIHIEMLLPNGNKEAAVDGGGVLRDALTEFWESFYEKCTEGRDSKVPVIREDFNSSKWEAAAKILLKGWQQAKYFPIKLSPVFIEYCVFGMSFSNVKDDLLNYLCYLERQLLSTALTKWDEIDFDELCDVLGALQCKRLPNKDNISELLYDIGHKELIQKPKFIIDCWSKHLDCQIDNASLIQIYENCKPDAKKVINMLECEDNSEDSKKVMNFLKKYIKETHSVELSALLRFITGADIITLDTKINVIFNQKRGLQRIPVGRTCGSVLELSVHYENYRDFKSDMSCVLKNKVWVMDLI